MLAGFGITFAGAVGGAVVGYGWGSVGTGVEAWEGMARSWGVEDVPGFVRVAQTHNGSYLGGAAGMILAVARLRSRRQGRSACREG
jgi:hypothetical protein